MFLCLFFFRPVQRFSDHIPTNLEETEAGSEPKLILKRIRGTSGSEKVSYTAMSTCMHRLLSFTKYIHVHDVFTLQFEALETLSTNSTTEIKSFEEREVEYEKARARIFSQSSNKLQDLSESTDKSFDLFNSNSSLRRLGKSKNVLNTYIYSKVLYTRKCTVFP